MNGALRPFDKSYKSAGLALMVEILTGPLVGASFTGIGDTATNWGNLVIAIDPEILTDRKEFAKNVSTLIAHVKKTKKLPGVKEIFMPGERGDRITKQRLHSGEIEIEDNLYHELKKTAGKAT
ncbi:Ldh family oxidoreductase [Candidatus Gottesmanbacteria bacterium]|nr:Ldh family oxidoreductase [Candidatus Gottesmanbacteria bacterium]